MKFEYIYRSITLRYSFVDFVEISSVVQICLIGSIKIFKILGPTEEDQAYRSSALGPKILKLYYGATKERPKRRLQLRFLHQRHCQM